MKKLQEIRCIIFDFANTLSSNLYFQTKPAGCPEWRKLFERYVFADNYWLTEWCNGRKSAKDIAMIISEHTGLPVEQIVIEMKSGCTGLAFNTAVYDFAKAQASQGRKTALVTANIDLFSEIVVPSHKLDRVFDTIVNSADYKTDNKLELWPIAFQSLGGRIDYECSLLLDDSEKWVTEFRKMGGAAFTYTDDSAFTEWLSTHVASKTA